MPILFGSGASVTTVQGGVVLHRTSRKKKRVRLEAVCNAVLASSAITSALTINPATNIWSNFMTGSCNGNESPWATWNSICSSSTIVNPWESWLVQGQSIPNPWGVWLDQEKLSKRQWREHRTAEAERQRTERERQEKWLQDERERQQKRERAHSRAQRLLDECLTDEQRQSLREKGHFYLYTQAGKKYRIDRGSHGNVKLVDESNRELTSYCIQPRGVPDPDAMLAQKLLLETDEEHFLKVANATEIRRVAAAG